MPGLNPDGLVGGASYYDAQARYPERLVVENVRDAVANGAVLQTYTRVTRIRVDARPREGVEWRTAQGVTGAASAPLFVNAAGPWVDEVLGPIKHTRLIGGTKGSHLIAPPFAGAPRQPACTSKRAATRGRCSSCRGTTCCCRHDRRAFRRRRRQPRRSTTRELAYLVQETERVFPAAAGLARPRALHAHRRAAAAVPAARRRGRDHAPPPHSPPSRRAWVVLDRRRQAHDASRACRGCAASLWRDLPRGARAYARRATGRCPAR